MKGMRKALVAAICALLIFATAFSALGEITILEVTVDGARVRTGPNEYELLGSLKKGTKVFYGGKKNHAYYRIISETGKVGWIFRDHIAFYSTVDEASIRVTAKSCKLYPKRKKKGGRKLEANTSVYVVSNDGEWAYVRTLSGKKGYVLAENLK